MDLCRQHHFLLEATNLIKVLKKPLTYFWHVEVGWQGEGGVGGQNTFLMEFQAKIYIFR